MVVKKIKIACLISLIFLIVLLCFVFFDSPKFNNDNESLAENDLFVVSIKSYGNYAIYDKSNNTYYFSKNNFNKSDIKIISPYKVKYNLEKLDDDNYNIYIYSNKYFQNRIIKIIDIPIISINTNNDYYLTKNHYDGLSIDDEGLLSNDVFVQIMDPNKSNIYYNHYFLESSMRIRGATSSIFPKKSFKLEFEKKISLFGMNRDDDWILDALYTDKSKIRNILSSDIWNLINDNQEINNDMHGCFTELFIDGQYQGLYVLKEKVNKDIMSVGDDGLIAKSYTHINNYVIDKFVNKSVSITRKYDESILGNLELKKFNNNSLNNFINKLGDYYSNYDYDSINKHFYLDNYLNYKLFIILISGVDNISKNQYLSMNDIDSKILITPWDLDLTFGLDYDIEDFLKSKNVFENYNDVLFIDDCLGTNVDSRILQALKKRYFDLRKNTINMKTINKYLDEYKSVIIDSGATLRDSYRWYYYDADYEIEIIRNWFERRLEFLDNYFNKI